MRNNFHNNAFTLAEVLITLGIIGVVAAMTLPTLINDYKVKTTVTKLKKFYSVISQAYLSAVQEYGQPELWGITGRDAGNTEEDVDTYYAENAILVKERLLKNVKILNTCNNAKDQTACGVADTYYYLNGNTATVSGGSRASTASALLSDGSTVWFLANTEISRGSGVLSKTYGLIYIDLNGYKAPNTFGKDVFVFYLTNQNITPIGTDRDTSYPYKTGCLSTGFGCAAWVIHVENMDYLKCSDLSWDGKHTCK